MSTLEIRQMSFEEATQVFNFLANYAFTPTPPLPDHETTCDQLKRHVGATFYGVFEDGQAQSIASIPTPMKQNLRGQIFDMGGIADVATHPASRRKGYVRKLMRFLYQVFYDQGYAVSCLYPFRESFYQRLGYVTFPQAIRTIFDTQKIQSILKAPHQGEVEMIAFSKGFPIYRQFLEKIHPLQHGMALFTIPQKETAHERKTWLAIARQGTDVVGIMQYALKDKMMNQTLRAYDFLFLKPEGKFLLLDWVARHIDQATKAELWLPPGQFGETLYTDIRPTYAPVFVAPMARVINIQKLNGLPVGAGEINIKLKDGGCPWQEGIWRLKSIEGRLVVSPAEEAKCTLTIQGLSALVYGIYDPEEFNIRGWGDPESDEQTILRALFPPETPFLHAMY